MAARLGISKQDVLDAARRVDSMGDPLTVANVATYLGCKPPSVYHHIPGGLQELKDHVTEERTIDAVLCEHFDADNGQQIVWSNPHGCSCHGTCPGPHWTLLRGEEIEDA